jgi:hypothetical protein
MDRSVSYRVSHVAPASADDLAWHRPDRHGITEYERRRSRELLASDERLLLDARGRDATGPILWLITTRRLVIVTHEQFDENVRDLGLRQILRVDRQRDWSGWTVHVAAGDGRHETITGLDGERGVALEQLVRARAGLCDD